MVWKIRHALLSEGSVYRNRGSGGEFLVERVINRDTVRLINTVSGWELTAHVITYYCSDGSIEWDYSTGGRFVELPVIRKEA